MENKPDFSISAYLLPHINKEGVRFGVAALCVAALVALLTRPLPIDPVLKGVLILMAAMPAATNSTMLCTIYGGNRALSAKLIFLSTALSIVTIPLWAAVYFG